MRMLTRPVPEDARRCDEGLGRMIVMHTQFGAIQKTDILVINLLPRIG